MHPCNPFTRTFVLAFGFASAALTIKSGTIDINKKPVAVIVGVSEETLTFSSLTTLFANIQSKWVISMLEEVLLTIFSSYIALRQ